MPTTCQVIDDAERARRRAEWERTDFRDAVCEGFVGPFRFEVLANPDGTYRLTGSILSLLANSHDPFTADIPIHAESPAAAVEDAKRLMYSRWGSEWDAMRVEFWPPDPESTGERPAERADAPAELLDQEGLWRRGG
jgi:hypothetical protein